MPAEGEKWRPILDHLFATKGHARIEFTNGEVYEPFVPVSECRFVELDDGWGWVCLGLIEDFNDIERSPIARFRLAGVVEIQPWRPFESSGADQED